MQSTAWFSRALWVHAASLLLSKAECWHLTLCLSVVGMPEAGWMHGWERQGVSQCWGWILGGAGGQG